MRNGKRARRGAYILPTLLTTANLSAGCIALVLLMNHAERAALAAAAAIIVAAFLDVFDGMVARATKTTSQFGMEYDSMADLISFGVAPAFLSYECCLRSLGPIGAAPAIWFVTCTAMRLARFNARSESGVAGFSGLPSPAAACTVASFIILVETVTRYPFAIDALGPAAGFHQALAPAVSLGMAALGFLMISRVPYLSFKRVNTSRPRPLKTILAVVLFLYIAWSIPGLMFGLFLFYVFLGIVLRFLTSVRWAEVVAPSLVAWAENMSAPQPAAGNKDRDANR